MNKQTINANINKINKERSKKLLNVNQNNKDKRDKKKSNCFFPTINCHKNKIYYQLGKTSYFVSKQHIVSEYINKEFVLVL